MQNFLLHGGFTPNTMLLKNQPYINFNYFNRCKILINEVRGGGSELVGLHLESTVVVKRLTLSRNWLILREAVPPGSAKPQMSKHQNTENKRHGWYTAPETSAPGKQISVVNPWICLSLQISGWQFSLQSQFPNGSKKHYWLSICSAFSCKEGTDDF